jgi:hypothetical protein
VRGGRAGPSHLFVLSAGPLAILAPRLAKGAAEKIWSRHGNESESEAIKRKATGRPRACEVRFHFKVGFHNVFTLTLEYLLNYLLNFRADIRGAAAARGLTTWDLIHRAGPAPTERAPRPSFQQDKIQPFGFPCNRTNGVRGCSRGLQPDATFHLRNYNVI